MALPAYPNAISLNAVNVELGRGATTVISLNDEIVRTLFARSSGTISFSHGHGKSNLSPPTFYVLDSGNFEVGSGIHAYVTNPNNTGLAYTASYTATNNCGGGYARSVNGTYTGTLAASGTHAISGPSAINNVIASYKANTIGEAGYYSVSIYFPSFNLTLSNSGTSGINIRGPDYQQTNYYNDECCRNGGCESGCNGSTTHEECNDNCCCYDCNGDGITACGDPADPDYDDSNPPCQNKCGDGVTDACGQSCNTACDNGSLVNCPYETVSTTYDIYYYPQC